MGRVAIGVEYDGAAYHGWQRQPHSTSVQEALQAALGRIADEPVELTCAGRTDAGVHARAQVAHFDTEAQRSARAWLFGRQQRACRRPSTCAGCSRSRSNFMRATRRCAAPTATWCSIGPRARLWPQGRALVVYAPLDAALMQRAADALVGEHDFSAFRAAECQARSPVRTIEALGGAALRRLDQHRGHRQRLLAAHGAQYRRHAAGRRPGRGGAAAHPRAARIASAQHRRGHRGRPRSVLLAGRLPAAVRPAGRFRYDRFLPEPPRFTQLDLV